MAPKDIIQHLEDWLESTAEKYKDATSYWGAGYQRAIEDVQLEIERLKAEGQRPETYEFSKHKTD